MQFKTPVIASQFLGLHPDLRVLLHDLDEWLWDNKMERLTVTDALRTREDQRRLYTKTYQAQRMSDAEAQDKAFRRFSYHLCACAADFRHTVKPYMADEQKRIWEWLAKHCTGSEWELLEHDLGWGKHFHIARRDFEWRRKWEQSEAGKA